MADARPIKAHILLPRHCHCCHVPVVRHVKQRLVGNSNPTSRIVSEELVTLNSYNPIVVH